jgi:hypothetical protein
MRKVSYVLLLLLFTVSCSHTDTLVVKGKVTDPSLNNSKVYFVALDGPISKNVDSTIIVDGKFSFEKGADTLSVKILRVPVRYPDSVEDLVTVLEEGTLEVELSSVSHGSGTRLNNILQDWKNVKHIHDSIQSSIYTRKAEEGISQDTIASLMKRSVILNQEYRTYVMDLMNENLNNGIGLLLFKIYYHALTPEERKRILDITGNSYPDHDAQLKLMISNDKSLNK